MTSRCIDNAVSKIQAFVEAMAPLLSIAMSLRGLPISDGKFYKRTAEIRSNMIRAKDIGMLIPPNITTL
jgi:hypothetical protein